MTRDTREEFAQRLQRHRGIVLKVAHAYATHPEDRADLVQEIAAQLWRAWPRYDDARAFPTWMYRIALNVAISHLREASLRQRHAVAFDEDLHDLADDDTGQEHAHALRTLQQFIRRQKPLDRALLLLYLEDRGQREMAEVLGITETNVATKIARLKQRIRDEL